MRAFSLAASEAEDGGEQADPAAWAGEGGQQGYPSLDLFGAAQSGPVLERVRAELTALANPPQADGNLDLLRTAECHGDGLVPLAMPEAGQGGQALALPGAKAAVGDMLFSAAGPVFAVAAVDEEGRVLRPLGNPDLDDDGHIRPGSMDCRQLRYFWRPDRRARVWSGPEEPCGEYADLPAAMVRLVRLWGETVGSRGVDLSIPGGSVAEVLGSAGIQQRGLADADDEAWPTT